MEQRERRWFFWVAVGLIIASNLPYLFAWAATPQEMHFTGLLVNPLDSHSYIAKMRQGLDGAWRFRLVFTPEEQEGAYLFLFHISLGHLARWSGLPLIVLYHGARVLASGVMLWMISRFVTLMGNGEEGRSIERPCSGQRRLAFLLIGLSSGLGWLVAPTTGHQPPDLWMPEAFPFYSMLYTVHFPLAMALMVGILILLARPGRVTGPRQACAAAVLSLVLGVIQPFAVIPVYATLAVWLAFRWLRDRQMDWRGAGWIAVAGLVAVFYPLYGLLSIRADPVLAGWDAQNQTPSPPVWDWLLGLGLPAALAVPGAVAAARRRTDGDLLLLAWIIAAGVGMYIPIPLQRRLALGLHIPTAMLAALGWWENVRPRLQARSRGVRGVLVAVTSLTNLFLIAMLVLVAAQGEPLFYRSDGEWRAFTWLRENVARDKVVLCTPEMGMLVPAWAGPRVVYGHPFETVNAEQRKAQVEAFWAGEMSLAEQAAFLEENRVAYVLESPPAARRAPRAGDWQVMFEADGVRIYAIGDR